METPLARLLTELGQKLTAEGRPLDLDPRDLYDLLELDKRTDRVLHNGYCLLPPRQPCDRGNACLTCGHFATDGSFLDEHERQLVDLVALIEHRDDRHAQRTGRPMSAEHIWKAERLREKTALELIIDACQSTPPRSAVRGAGVAARQPTNASEAS